MTAYAPCGGSKLPKSSIAVDTMPSWHMAEHTNDRLRICVTKFTILHDPLLFTVTLFIMSAGNTM